MELSGALTAQQACALPLPRQVPRTQAVKKLWQTILQEVARHELRVGDLPLIEAMFVAKVRHSQAGALVKRQGFYVEKCVGFTKDGDPIYLEVKNPALKEERDQAVLYDKLAQRLGLSPESRIRLDLMQIAGATLLGTLKKSLEELTDEDQGEEVIDAEVLEEE